MTEKHGIMYLVAMRKEFSEHCGKYMMNGTRVKTVQVVERMSEKLVKQDKKTPMFDLRNLCDVNTDEEKKQVYYISKEMGSDYMRAIDIKKPTATAKEKAAIKHQQQISMTRISEASGFKYTQTYTDKVQKSILSFGKKKDTTTTEIDEIEEESEPKRIKLGETSTSSSFDSNRSRYNVVELGAVAEEEDEDDNNKNKIDSPLFRILTTDPVMPTGVTMPNSLRLLGWIANNIDLLYVITDHVTSKLSINQDIRNPAGKFVNFGKDSSLLINLFLMRHAKKFALERSEKNKKHEIPLFVMAEVMGKEDTQFAWYTFHWEINKRGNIVLECTHPKAQRIGSHKYDSKFSILYSIVNKDNAQNSGLAGLYQQFLKNLRTIIRNSERDDGGYDLAEYKEYVKKTTNESDSSSSKETPKDLKVGALQQGADLF